MSFTNQTIRKIKTALGVGLAGLTAATLVACGSAESPETAPAPETTTTTTEPAPSTTSTKSTPSSSTTATPTTPSEAEKEEIRAHVETFQEDDIVTSKKFADWGPGKVFLDPREDDTELLIDFPNVPLEHFSIELESPQFQANTCLRVQVVDDRVDQYKAVRIDTPAGGAPLNWEEVGYQKSEHVARLACTKEKLGGNTTVEEALAKNADAATAEGHFQLRLRLQGDDIEKAS